MSAFIVTMTTIDALVTYAMGGGPLRVSGENPNKLGQMLVNENYRSVNYRYRESDAAERYTFRPYVKPLSPVQVLKLCDCYDYQSCETDDYTKTEAARLIEAIRSKATRALPGYEAASWDLPEARSNAVLLSAL